MLSEEYISATNLSKHTSSTLDAFDRGDVDKMIVLKNNAPKAVLLSIEAFETMQEEIEDLRLASLAFARQQSFNPDKALSHQQIMEKFSE